MAAITSSIDDLVRSMGLQPHPEGGWYRRTFEAGIDAALDDRWASGTRRHAATSIMYLLPAGGKCSLHRLKSDELWFWHSGSPINVIELVSPAEPGGDAGVRSTVLGQQPTGPFTHRVPGGTVFGCFVPAAASVAAPGTVAPPAWALVSCVVVPGFDFADWAMPGAPELLAEFRGGAAAAAVGLLSTGATQPAPPAALLSSPP